MKEALSRGHLQKSQIFVEKKTSCSHVKKHAYLDFLVNSWYLAVLMIFITLDGTLSL